MLKPKANCFFLFTHKKYPPTLSMTNESEIQSKHSKVARMPPELPSFHSLIPSSTPLLRPLQPKSRLHSSPTRKSFRNMSIVAAKKLVPAILFVLTAVSLLRFLNLALTATSGPPAGMALPPILLDPNKNKAPPAGRTTSSFSSSSDLTKKETRFISRIISERAPCNLLIFGIQEQYSEFPLINVGGNTVFLDDHAERPTTAVERVKGSRTYGVRYKNYAKDAYKLLKDAREERAGGCTPRTGGSTVSKCGLALRGLPREVYETQWDVIVVDGPSGDRPDTHGRMETIFTAGLLTRRGNMTDVVVHDVNRTVEKWFSREFLSEDNLVSSKGKFWNFRISQQLNSSCFCPVPTRID